LRREIDADCKEQVESAMRAVEEVLAGENQASQTGDVNRLKAALAALDEASKPLAELLMDKAMDAMLRVTIWLRLCDDVLWLAYGYARIDRVWPGAGGWRWSLRR
jgi:hypothetical protein